MRQFLVLPLFFFLACTRPGAGHVQSAAVVPPEQVVKNFVALSGGAQALDDRRKLQDLCVGELKRDFEQMSDDEFKAAYLNGKVKLEDIKVLDTVSENGVAHVHYLVTVDNAAGSDKTKEMNEREVDLKLSQGAWYIEIIRTKGSDKLAFTRGMIF